MSTKLGTWWAGWRERSRQYKIERAMYRASGGRLPQDGGAPGTPGRNSMRPHEGVDIGGGGSGGLSGDGM